LDSNTSAAADADKGKPMRGSTERIRETESVDQQTATLLELVEAVADVTSDDREVVATVLHLLRSGRVRLIGNFRGEPLDSFGH
jgi:hypothetical protein